MTGDTYELTGIAVPEDMEQLHDLLERAAHDHPHVPGADVMMFETAVMEIANNVVEHVGVDGPVRWGFRLEVRPEALYAELFDSGQLYAEWEAGDQHEMPDLLAESGRGLPLASAVLDDLGYHRVGGINVWTMVRRWSS